MLDMIASGPIGSRNVEWDITFGPSLLIVGRKGTLVLVATTVRGVLASHMSCSKLGTWDLHALRRLACSLDLQACSLGPSLLLLQQLLR